MQSCVLLRHIADMLSFFLGCPWLSLMTKLWSFLMGLGFWAQVLVNIRAIVNTSPETERSKCRCVFQSQAMEYALHEVVRNKFRWSVCVCVSLCVRASVYVCIMLLLQVQQVNTVNWSQRVLSACRLPNLMSLTVPNAPVHFYTCQFKTSKLTRYSTSNMVASLCSGTESPLCDKSNFWHVDHGHYPWKI